MPDQMPSFTQPKVRVLAMNNFIAAPGHVARAGEIIEVTADIANTAIALGNARLPTERDEPEHIEVREPAPQTRDPRNRRRR